MTQNLSENWTTQNPNHYTRWKHQPLDFIIHNNIPFAQGNAIKYLMRYDVKGTPTQDLLKAQKYLSMLNDTPNDFYCDYAKLKQFLSQNEILNTALGDAIFLICIGEFYKAICNIQRLQWA